MWIYKDAHTAIAAQIMQGIIKRFSKGDFNALINDIFIFYPF
jgi:hypothetical protein